MPRLRAWRPGLAGPMAAAAAGTLDYSLATRYAWGTVDVLTTEEHLALDAPQGAAFCAAAAALLADEPREVRLMLAGHGLFAPAAATLTARRPG